MLCSNGRHRRLRVRLRVIQGPRGCDSNVGVWPTPALLSQASICTAVCLLQLPAWSSLCGPNQRLFHCPLWQLTQWAGACWVAGCLGLLGWIAALWQQTAGQQRIAGLAWMCGPDAPVEVLAQPWSGERFIFAGSWRPGWMCHRIGAGAVAVGLVCRCMCAACSASEVVVVHLCRLHMFWS
ncbi:hypothetical protein COO60DRAFT_1523156 [Scenedesmus sp. NREL 46B-D3]|nr:hypothetical protein COO60DRAFT_1523156 [Scenedesmus sp. NREL 46B-D3]